MKRSHDPESPIIVVYLVACLCWLVSATRILAQTHNKGGRACHCTGTPTLAESISVCTSKGLAMNEKEFIEKIQEIPYSKVEYASLGVSEDYILKTIEGYSPKHKAEVRVNAGNDPLIRLVTNYDMSKKAEIGMIWFGSAATETDDYYYIGQLEVDHLCISKFSHEVMC